MKDNKKIFNYNIDAIENGYIISYVQDNKSKRRAFYTWKELIDWLSEQNGEEKDVTP